MDLQSFINRHAHWFLAIFPFYFLSLWLLGSTIISCTGGWHTLAATFRTHNPFVGKQWKGQSAHMQWVTGYHRCLTFGSSREGLYLSIISLFRFMHPPLLIPWSEIEVRRRKVWFLGEFVTLRLGRETPVPVTIRGRLAEKLCDSAADQWPIEKT